MRTLQLLTLAMAMAVAATSSAHADEGAPRCDLDNPGLRPALLAKKVPYLPVEKSADALNRVCEAGYDTLKNWSSTFLKPSGAKPRWRKSGPDEADGSTDLFNHQAFVDWCGEFSAWSTADGDLATAWCEGAPGDGVGEVVISPVVDPSKPVEIAIGYSKSPALYAANGRPHRVRVHLMQELANPRYPCPQYGEHEAAHGLEVGPGWQPLMDHGAHSIAHVDVDLRDTPAFQPVLAPRFVPQPAHAYFVAVELLSVFPGAKHHDTCVSEIRNAPPVR